ncbi:MAG: hypothetical protein R3B47_07420 [Bacteroidia bacterium]
MPVPLSAVGFGEPSFAAYYPNSRQMFGYHDDTAQTKGLIMNSLAGIPGPSWTIFFSLFNMKMMYGLRAGTQQPMTAARSRAKAFITNTLT